MPPETIWDVSDQWSLIPEQYDKSSQVYANGQFFQLNLTIPRRLTNVRKKSAPFSHQQAASESFRQMEPRLQ